MYIYNLSPTYFEICTKFQALYWFTFIKVQFQHHIRCIWWWLNMSICTWILSTMFCTYLYESTSNSTLNKNYVSIYVLFYIHIYYLWWISRIVSVYLPGAYLSPYLCQICILLVVPTHPPLLCKVSHCNMAISLPSYIAGFHLPLSLSECMSLPIRLKPLCTCLLWLLTLGSWENTHAAPIISNHHGILHLTNSY